MNCFSISCQMTRQDSKTVSDTRQQDSVRHKTVDSVRATRSFTRVSLPQEKKKAIKEQKNARERIAGIWIAGTCIWIAGTCISARAHMT